MEAMCCAVLTSTIVGAQTYTKPSELFRRSTSSVNRGKASLRALPAKRNYCPVAAQSDWSSSNRPSRAVVNEEIGGIPVGEYGEKIIVPSCEDEDEYAGDIKVECDESGCVIVVPKTRTLAEEDNGFGYLRCDLTGCYFTEEPPVERSFEVIEGEGWRLGYETAPDSEDSFCAIVGAGGWSIALTAAEFNDFCTLIQMLRKGITSVDQDGIKGRDDVVLQVEKGSVWMECNIPKKRVAVLQNLWKSGSSRSVDKKQLQAFELRFILSGVLGRRQAEGFWPAEAVMDMINKVDAAAFDSIAPNSIRPAAANA